MTYTLNVNHHHIALLHGAIQRRDRNAFGLTVQIVLAMNPGRDDDVNEWIRAVLCP